jgi:hypothetical protein
MASHFVHLAAIYEQLSGFILVHRRSTMAEA